MTTAIDRIFRAHPRTVGESYLEHFAFALRFSGRLTKAGGAALVHALIPCLCQSTASSEVIKLHDEIMARRRAAETH